MPNFGLDARNCVGGLDIKGNVLGEPLHKYQDAAWPSEVQVQDMLDVVVTEGSAIFKLLPIAQCAVWAVR